MPRPLPHFALPAALLAGSMGAIVTLYSLGWTGSFHFDDAVNLSGLTEFQVTGDWLAWVSSGRGGPGGRSIALASFLVDAHHWPASPYQFLVNNTLLHVINGLLAALVFIRITALREGAAPAATPAVFAAILWMFLPILASTTLIVVQRMALIAAAFLLAGLYLYLVGRQMLSERPILGSATMLAGIAGGAGLGFLSKENAILLPLLILVVEYTLLYRSRPSQIFAWRFVFWLGIILPSAAVVFLGLLHWNPAGYVERDFSLAERLSTQPVILWDYLRLSFFPQSTAFSPFHDGYRPFGLPWLDSVAGAALLGWLLLIGIALATRRRNPLLAYAVFWYLGAHFIESTGVPLELYYEHRNYIPLLGPVFALVIFLYQLATRFNYRFLATVGGALYLLLSAIVLGQTTSLWGQPALAAEIWHREQPESIRSAQYLANSHIAQGSADWGIRVLESAQRRYPDSIVLSLQLVQVTCQSENFEAQSRHWNTAKELAGIAVVPYQATTTIRTLSRLALDGECSDTLPAAELEDLVISALANNKLRGGAINRAHLFNILAEIRIYDGDLNGTMEAIETAMQLRPSIGMLRKGMAILNSAGLYCEAMIFARSHTPLPAANTVQRRRLATEVFEMLEAQTLALRDTRCAYVMD